MWLLGDHGRLIKWHPLVNFQFFDVQTKLVTGKPHQFTRFFYAFYLTIGSVLEVSARMVCPSCKKRRPSSKAPASKNICDYISNAQNKETQCFFALLCFYKQTKQTLEVLSFIMKKQDNFLKEVVSFMKTQRKYFLLELFLILQNQLKNLFLH